jgi:ABC-2 type transport system ATP-binding protein
MRSLDIEGNRVTVEMEAEDARISEIMSELVHQGIPMRSFNDKEPTLEDVFMMVTKGLVT